MSKILTKTVKTRKPDTRIQSLVSKSKYPKCHKCTNPSPSPSPSDNCDVVTCGGRKIFFRNFSPITLTSNIIQSLGILPGDIWFDCSQTPSKEYIYVSASQYLYASDVYGNVYSVNTNTGIGTLISLYAQPFTASGSTSISGDIVINQNSTLGFVFGIISGNFSSIYEFSLTNPTTINSTGRDALVTQLSTNPNCTDYSICAAMFFNNTFYICVYATIVNPSGPPGDTYYVNQLYTIDSSGVNITTTYVGDITGIPTIIPAPGYTATQTETVSGMVFDDVTNKIYFVTSYNLDLISYQPGTLYTLNLTTLVATSLTNITFPPLPLIQNPVANSLTKYKGEFYVGSYSKDADPNINSPYLFRMTLDGNLTAVSTSNLVFDDTYPGGVVGLSGQSDYFKPIGI